MKKFSKNRKFATIFAVLSALCFVVSFSNVPNTFARYIVSASGTASIDVAKPLLIIDVTTPTDTIDPLNSLDINFNVKNFENSSTTDVQLEYYLSFSNTGSVPLTYSLKNNSSNENVPLDSNNKTTVATSIPTSQTTHPYTLTLTWDSTGDKSISLANITDTLIITADVKQSFRSGS